MKNPEKFIEELKALIQEHSHTRAAADRMLCRIYLRTYEWITWVVETKKFPHKVAAGKSLGSSVKRSEGTIQTWALFGSFMIDNNLTDIHDPRSVRLLAANRKSLPKHALLKATQLLKDLRPYSEVYRSVVRHLGAHQSLVYHRMIGLERKRKLTKEHLRMEMIAIQTMAKKVFDREDIIVSITDGGFAPLLDVGASRVLA